MKLETGFGSWPELVNALGRKTHRKLKPWQRRVATNRNNRTRKHNRELSRDRAKFVKKAIDGSAARARPGATARMATQGRWLELLRVMGDSDWTMARLCEVFDRDMPTTHATVKRRMIERGLVEKRANPNETRYVIAGGHMAGIATRAGKDRWLYRRTEAGARVADGSDEWRKVRNGNINRYKFRRIREARNGGRAGKSGLG